MPKVLSSSFLSCCLHDQVFPWATGSSVLKALLADGTFTPRAVTRNPNSEKALELKQLGVEVVQGDHWDVLSLKNAMNGAEAVFGVISVLFFAMSLAKGPFPQVTNFWDPENFAQGPTSETLLGKNMVDAAIEADIKFFVWR